MITADYHVHTRFSSDGKATMEEMAEQALKLGLKKLCFTDHMDYDYPKSSDGMEFVFDPDIYFEKINEIKERYHGKLEILAGIELGLQPHLKERISNLTKSYPFDFIIGSSHLVNGSDPFHSEYWEDKTNAEGIRTYFETIAENCRSIQNFHVYGHLDYIIRYIPGQAQAITKETYDYLDYADVLDEALKTIISSQKGIEVNTAGYKYGLGCPNPKLEIIKRYKELGGEIITIGSDAHMPEYLTYEFNRIPEMLISLGFRYYTTFVQGKPIFEKL